MAAFLESVLRNYDQCDNCCLFYPELAGLLNTMLNRSAPTAPPTLALEDTEMRLLGRLVKDSNPPRARTLVHDLIKIARLGGYLARANDPPPENTVMWRGLSRLTDTLLGAMIGAGIVGN